MDASYQISINLAK